MNLLQTVKNNVPVSREPYYWSTFILPSGEFVRIDQIDWESVNHNENDYFPTCEHEDLSVYLNTYCDTEIKWGDGTDFILDGAIKLNITYPYVILPKIKPTNAQLNALEIWLKQVPEEANFDADFEAGNLDMPLYIEILETSQKFYDLAVYRPSDIIDAIEDSYKVGQLVESNSKRLSEEFDQAVYYDLEEKLIDLFYNLSEAEILSYYDEDIETGGGAVWILPDGKTIELDLHSDFCSDAFYRFCRAYFKEHPEYSEDYDENDFALEDAFEYNDRLVDYFDWVKYNSGTIYDERCYVCIPQKITDKQYRVLENIIDESAENGCPDLLVLPQDSRQNKYYDLTIYSGRDIIKKIRNYYVSRVLEESTERYNGMIFTDSPYTIRDYCVNRPDAYRILYDANIDLYMLCDASLYIHWNLIQQAFNLGYYSELKNDEDLDPIVREYVASRDLFNYTDLGVDGCYEGDDGIVEFGQYLMYAIWVPKGMTEDEIENSPSRDGYDDEFKFPAGSLFTRGLDTDLMNRVDLINILRRSKFTKINENVLNETIKMVDRGFYITDSPYAARDVLVNKPASYRILYDSKVDLYLIGDAYDYIHSELLEQAVSLGYYAEQTDYIDSLGGLYDYARQGCDQFLYYMVFTPDEDSWDEFTDSVGGSDGYDCEYKFDCGTIFTREDNFKEVPLYNIMKKQKKLNSRDIKESVISNDFLSKIIAAWGKDTCHPAYIDKWSEANPAAGQCLATALVIQDELGGDIYDCKVGRSRHFYNVVNGEIIDLTFSQFPENSKITDSRIRDRKQLLANKETRHRYELLKSRMEDKSKVIKETKIYKPKQVELDYDDLEITVTSPMDWDDNYQEETISTAFTYRVDQSEVEAFMLDYLLSDQDCPLLKNENASDEEFDAFFEIHFEELFEKYYDAILDGFEYDARKACESGYGWNDYTADERDDYADFLYDQWRDSQFESIKEKSLKLTITEDWDNSDTEFIDYVLAQFEEFLSTWPVSPYDRDSDIADVDTLISRFLTKGLTEEKVQQVIDEMETYLDYSGIELDDEVDLNHGSLWDWTDKYTHYLIVEQNFAGVLDTVGYEKAKELVQAWKQRNKIKYNIKTENLINREEPPYYNFNEFWFFVAKYWLDCDAERSALNDAFDYGMSHPEAVFNDCPVFYDRYNHEGEYLELAFEAGQESADFIV